MSLRSSQGLTSIVPRACWATSSCPRSVRQTCALHTPPHTHAVIERGDKRRAFSAQQRREKAGRRYWPEAGKTQAIPKGCSYRPTDVPAAAGRTWSRRQRAGPAARETRRGDGSQRPTWATTRGPSATAAVTLRAMPTRARSTTGRRRDRPSPTVTCQTKSRRLPPTAMATTTATTRVTAKRAAMQQTKTSARRRVRVAAVPAVGDGAAVGTSGGSV
jgi:hypothetical protein